MNHESIVIILSKSDVFKEAEKVLALGVIVLNSFRTYAVILLSPRMCIYQGIWLISYVQELQKEHLFFFKRNAWLKPIYMQKTQKN